MNHQNITFIGAGHMADALIGGLIRSGYPADKIHATAPDDVHLQMLTKKWNVRVHRDNQQGAAQAKMIILAVKPQHVATVAQELSSLIKTKKPLVISIAAGIRTQDLQTWLGFECPVVRCMPNTPALINAGATALFANSLVTTEQRNCAESILRTVGMTLWLDEEQQMDIVTALSGSGPAYYFLLMEALEQGAAILGLPEKTAHLLTLQTALGAARMALESGKTAAELRQQVTSPGGTTAAGLDVLLKNNFHEIIKNVLHAAQQRSKDLGEEFSQQ